MLLKCCWIGEMRNDLPSVRTIGVCVLSLPSTRVGCTLLLLHASAFACRCAAVPMLVLPTVVMRLLVDHVVSLLDYRFRFLRLVLPPDDRRFSARSEYGIRARSLDGSTSNSASSCGQAVHRIREGMHEGGEEAGKNDQSSLLANRIVAGFVRRNLHTKRPHEHVHDLVTLPVQL